MSNMTLNAVGFLNIISSIQSGSDQASKNMEAAFETSGFRKIPLALPQTLANTHNPSSEKKIVLSSAK